MPEEPTIVEVEPMNLAAVFEPGPWMETMKRFRPLLDEVWTFLRAEKATTGHNVFVYEPEGTWLGVQVEGPVPEHNRVILKQTPEGQAATTTHWGSYDGIRGATDRLIAWCRANGHATAGTSWEVYGDWYDEVTKVRTDIFFLLK
jgi:effector-binding domain-containing protein